jgi:hypothetical protein
MYTIAVSMRQQKHVAVDCRTCKLLKEYGVMCWLLNMMHRLALTEGRVMVAGKVVEEVKERAVGEVMVKAEVVVREKEEGEVMGKEVEVVMGKEVEEEEVRERVGEEG